MAKSVKANKANKAKADISVSIVGHNEGRHLKELLPTLSWAREVIYVDCESTDDSVVIAKRCGCRVFSRKNNFNINVNKQFGLSQARGGWILYLDPDERLTEEGVAEIRKMAEGDHGYNAFRQNRKNFVIDRFLLHGGGYPDEQLRFFRKGYAHFLQDHIHEFLRVEGKVGKLKEDMIHYSYLNIEQFLFKSNRDNNFESKYMIKLGMKPSLRGAVLFIILKPAHMFLLKYFFRRGFLDGYPGFTHAFMSGFGFVVRYLKFWELTRTSEREGGGQRVK